ncbi:MAG: dihydrolipoyl dehydrogenase [Prevotellaceae bacterium]|jgi:dihydrolipoamide dehydrogenase|nr:dihydrolipoyl dehydrogenase [Prevotellaceae bacterium]
MFDLVAIGSGPGGYVAAIRAAQLGMKVALVEKENIGGVCLNYGCIPTKALLKSAQVLHYAHTAAEYGVELPTPAVPNFANVIARSRGVAENMRKGVEFLLNKNKVELIQGAGRLLEAGKVEVSDVAHRVSIVEAKHIIVATGARARELPMLPVDGKKILGYRHALTFDRLPKSMLVVGSGAIGSELAYFYAMMGTKVTILESLPQIAPNCDADVSRQLDRSLRKYGIHTMVLAQLLEVDTSGELCRVEAQSKKGVEQLEVEVILSAVGVQANIEHIGLERLGIAVENGKIKVDEFYETNAAHVYAIGDIIATPALAHVASAEAIACVEKLAGLDVNPINYAAIPSCIYTSPEVASVGVTEQQAQDKGLDFKVAKLPYTASGKAVASGARDGFVKLICDAKTDKILGAHLVGANVTEMLAEPTLAMNLGLTAHQIGSGIHAHPTMSEAIMEAAEAIHGKSVHI